MAASERRKRNAEAFRLGNDERLMQSERGGGDERQD